MNANPYKRILRLLDFSVNFELALSITNFKANTFMVFWKSFQNYKILIMVKYI